LISSLVWVRYNKRPINLLYSPGFKINEPSLSESGQDGSMGEKTGLQANKPLSERVSKQYFYWLRTILDSERLISNPKKERRVPRVRIIGLKQEGGQLFMKDFHKY